MSFIRFSKTCSRYVSVILLDRTLPGVHSVSVHDALSTPNSNNLARQSLGTVRAIDFVLVPEEVDRRGSLIFHSSVNKNIRSQRSLCEHEY